MSNLISLRELAKYHNQEIRSFTYRFKLLAKTNPKLLIKNGEKTSKLLVSLIELKKVCPELLPANVILDELQTQDNKQIQLLNKKVKMLEEKLEAVLELLKVISE